LSSTRPRRWRRRDPGRTLERRRTLDNARREAETDARQDLAFNNWRGVNVSLIDSPNNARRIELGTTPTQRVSQPLPAFEPGVDYIVKWEVDVGTVMRAKVWKATDAEPGWQVSASDPGGATFGGVDSNLTMFSVLQQGITQTKRIDYVRVDDLYTGP
jgi:hypothetical protein